MTEKLTRRLLGRGKPKTTALRDVAPNVDVEALLKRGDFATLASASRELEMRARSALAGFVEECRLSLEYEELKGNVKDDLKAVAALLKQRADNEKRLGAPAPQASLPSPADASGRDAAPGRRDPHEG